MVPVPPPDPALLRLAVEAFVELAFSYEERSQRWHSGADALYRQDIGKVLTTVSNSILEQYERRHSEIERHAWTSLRDYLAELLPEREDEWTDDLKREIADDLCARFEAEHPGYDVDRMRVRRVLLKTTWNDLYNTRLKTRQGRKVAAAVLIGRIVGDASATGRTAQKRLSTLGTDESPLLGISAGRSAFKKLGKHEHLKAVPLSPFHHRQLLVEYLADVLGVGPIHFLADDEPPPKRTETKPATPKARKSKKSRQQLTTARPRSRRKAPPCG